MSSANVIRGKRVLITGGAGMIGSTLADQLVEAGVGEIVVLDNFARGRMDNLAWATEHGNVNVIEGDIRDLDTLARAMEGVDTAFHMAAIRINQCAIEHRLAVEVLGMGSFNVYEAAAEAGVRKVVTSSTASVYGLAETFPTTEDHHPYANDTLYGAAKAFNEGMLRAIHADKGLDYIALRYFNVYGPRIDTHGKYTEVLVRWMQRIDEGLPPLINGDGTTTMDFVEVSDVARANVLAAMSDATDEAFNVASGVETSLLELAQALANVMGSDLEPELGPQRTVNKVSRRLADTSKAREILGFETQVSLEEGLVRLVDWYRAARAAGTAPDGEGRMMEVPFARPLFTEADGAAVAEAVMSGWVSQGPRVRAFEEAFAARVGAKEAVATTNCTTALQLALYVAGVGPGDEVVVPSLSFIATANAVWQNGATPVFADIDPDTYNLDPASAEQAITDADQGDHAGPPDRPAGRHGSDLRARRASRARRRRGRRVRDRRQVQGPPGRLARRSHLLLAAPAQGHHDRRRRHDHAGRRRCRRTAAQAAPARHVGLRSRPS